MENTEKPQYLDLNELRERYKNGIPPVSFIPGKIQTDPTLGHIAALIEELTLIRKQANATSWLILREWDPYEEFVPAYPQEWAVQLKEDPRYSQKIGTYDDE